MGPAIDVVVFFVALYFSMDFLFGLLYLLLYMVRLAKDGQMSWVEVDNFCYWLLVCTLLGIRPFITVAGTEDGYPSRFVHLDIQ